LKGKTALVTGGNRGIGLEVCRLLGLEGARVLLGSRDAVKGEEAAKEIRENAVDVSVIQIDLSELKSVRKAIERIEAPVDILVNNAAVLDRSHFLGLGDGELEQTLQVNLIGPAILSKHLSKGMKERNWGRIVNVSSGMGAIGRGLGSDSVAYRLSKLALNGLTVCLAEAMRGSGVLVNSVDPGWVRTEMGGAGAHRTPQEGAKGIVWAVLLPDRGPTGCFFRDGKRVDW
jgi:NAD(P)-dependent dehydrogenase (short-subunit alcohol dehydrogenase family)